MSYSVYVTKAREARQAIAVRVSEAGLAAIDRIAEEEDRSRSEVVRRMLAYATWKMPRGWKP